MRKVLSKLAIAAAATIGAVSSAQAYVILTISDVTGGVVTKTCDTSVGGCSAEFGVFAIGANALTFNGIVGDFQVQQTSGITISNANFALAQANNNLVNRTDGAAGLQGLVIEFTAMDVMAPPDVLKTLSGSGSMSGAPFGTITASDTVQTRVAVNSANLNSFFPPFALGGSSGTVTAMGCTFVIATNASCAATSTGTTGVGATSVVWSDPAVPFSFQTQQRFDINASAFVGTTATAVVGRLPEPASTALVGIALFGLAATARRRSAKKA
ncbi:exported hypothetical protein [Rubrivivax sp. A210]|uniref:PEP-CTERM sorting domain-containing protein n=1 Tax=Rubrivivax sp. A210 TaxID=2772301 RepID=UPI0019182046|nr:PEP-CTERM sorting domain-containing protein [Rubrivivax sp. A210]CAD5375198.1 exported hypothetical protein [Rubrivivax sp. A210]